MKALSIKQPWASAIVCGEKDIENRSWNTKFRGTFLVHASKELDKRAPAELIEKYKDHPRGVIVGCVDLTDTVVASESPWFHGPHGFVLRNPRKAFLPVRCRGSLGFYETPFHAIPEDRDEHTCFVRPK